MADKLQNRLSNFEVEPPQHMWAAIVTELTDQAIGHRIHSFEVNPPVNNFQSILSSLNEETEIKAEPASAGKLIDFNWRKVAIAASIIGLAGTLIFFLFFNNVTPGKQQRIITSVINPTIPETNLAVTPNPVVVDQATPVKSPATVLSRENYIRNAANVNNRSPRRFIASSLLNHDHEDKIEVTAPPITDQNGKPILDRTLLTGNNSAYITVTSPNGEQTKISVKFLDYVSKFYDMTNQDDEWKQRFETWKTIMLQEASFTPAPGNFMDLLELKDILIHQ
ncbi:MAG: hypothetical protein ACXWV5_11965 [Flavitalea sp.]